MKACPKALARLCFFGSPCCWCWRRWLLVGRTTAHRWVDDEVSFVADGLTIYGTYRHQPDGGPAAAALLISESGQTDRNGDNAVAGPVGNMRQLAELLSDRGVASLRYDKVGTGKTGLGPYAKRPRTSSAPSTPPVPRSAVRFLAEQPATDKARISVYALGEGTIHAMSLAADTTPGAPKIHSLGLFQPLPGRYLDIITDRVHADADAAVDAGAKNRAQADQVWRPGRQRSKQVRTRGTVPAQLPDGLGARSLNPANVKAVVEADEIDPLALAARGARRHPGAADVFGRRRPGQLRRRAAAHRRARAHRADRRRTQGRQPRAARRPQ